MKGERCEHGLTECQRDSEAQMCATPKTILRSEIDDGMRQVMGEQASVCRPAKGEPTTTRTGAHPLVVYQPRGTTRAERTKNEQKRRRASVAGTLGSKRTKIAARGNFTSTNRVGDRGKRERLRSLNCPAAKSVGDHWSGNAGAGFWA